MAIYHFSAQIISRSNGSSAVRSSAYRSGEKIEDERTGLIHDYTRKSGVEHTEILTPDNAPEWAEKYDVMSIPTIIIFNKGNVVNQFVGLTSKEEIEEKI